MSNMEHRGHSKFRIQRGSSATHLFICHKYMLHGWMFVAITCEHSWYAFVAMVDPALDVAFRRRRSNGGVQTRSMETWWSRRSMESVFKHVRNTRIAVSVLCDAAMSSATEALARVAGQRASI